MCRLFHFFTLCAVFAVVRNEEMPDCAAGAKTPYRCLFMGKSARLGDKACCYPVLSNSQVNLFSWHQRDLVKNGLISSFMILDETCSKDTLTREFAIRKGAVINCLPRDGIKDDMPSYPIRHSQISGNAAADAYYCNNKFTSVYDAVITCWLYNCGPRLKIPDETKKVEGKAVNLCYPPIMYKEDSKSYCELYATKPSDEKPCEWPPVCGKEETIDQSQYLIPLVNGEPNAKYCEVLCPSHSNTGTNDGKPCRQVPICPPSQTTNELKGEDFANVKINPYKLHTCYSFCTEENSMFLVPEKRTGANKDCQPLPRCTNGSKPGAPFTGANPFGATDCVKLNNCKNGDDPKVVNCIPTNDPLTNVAGGGGGSTASNMTLTFILVGVIVPVVAIALIVVIVVVVLKKRKAKKKGGAKSNVVVMKNLAESNSTKRTNKLQTLSGRLREDAKNPNKQRSLDPEKGKSFRSNRIVINTGVNDSDSESSKR